MMAQYEFTVEAECPVDGATIPMAVSVTLSRLLLVEDLLAIAKELTAAPVMQEPFTEALADRLRAPVKTVATHSGVEITCWA